jgi:acyl-CoA synthetase (AMP-forming)/AMP-acid ligase II
MKIIDNSKTLVRMNGDLSLKQSYYQAPTWVPPVQHTTAELLDIRGASHPNREAIVIRVIGKPRRAITYGELKDRTEKLAAGMIKRGLKKGDSVALLCPTSIEYAICEYALARTGAVLMRFHVSVKTGEDIKELLKKSDCRWLMVHPGDEEREYHTLVNVVPGLQYHDPTTNFCIEHFPKLETIFMLSSTPYPGTIPWTY